VDLDASVVLEGALVGALVDVAGLGGLVVGTSVDVEVVFVMLGLPGNLVTTDGSGTAVSRALNPLL
jgi:hypothetical protein